ncbi:MAG: NfeD family protein, partial [Ignavibacteriales bacterium]|nr:NfeD family protein [Ignavibacteriales bacterium]
MESSLLYSPVVVWFFIGLILLLVELSNPGFILFFFGLGAWIVAVVYIIFPVNLITQLIIFLGTSLLSLFLLRNKFKELFSGFLKGKDDPLKNLDDSTGKIVKVTHRIAPPERGKVELFGTSWLAESDTVIEAG